MSLLSLSIVIPVKNDSNSLFKVLSHIKNLYPEPKEIIIVDSSFDNSNQKIVENLKNTIPITYHHVKQAYPGRARNIGVSLAKYDWIAFLDCKTQPYNKWLQRYTQFIETYNVDVVFGVTKFEAITTFQKNLRASSFGKIGHQTVPGTLVKKSVFYDSGGFIEDLRMGEDIEWRNRLNRHGYKVYKPVEPVLSYSGLSDNLCTTLKKYFFSSYHSARTDIQLNIKEAYLSLALILSAIILPKWNHLIDGWDSNLLFIPHFTKIYLIALVCLLLIYQLTRYLLFRNIAQTLFSRTLKIMVLIFITLTVYQWNAVIVGWMEDAVLYVPHITKVYVSGLVVTSIFYRGLALPLRREVEPGFLFPVRWIKVGLLGLLLDLIKAPAYVFGAIGAMFR